MSNQYLYYRLQSKTYKLLGTSVLAQAKYYSTDSKTVLGFRHNGKSYYIPSYKISDKGSSDSLQFYANGNYEIWESMGWIEGVLKITYNWNTGSGGGQTFRVLTISKVQSNKIYGTTSCKWNTTSFTVAQGSTTTVSKSQTNTSAIINITLANGKTKNVEIPYTTTTTALTKYVFFTYEELLYSA